VKIYLAGNTPGRRKEEELFQKKNLAEKRLFAYHYLITDKTMFECFKIRVKNENISGSRRSGRVGFSRTFK